MAVEINPGTYVLGVWILGDGQTRDWLSIITRRSTSTVSARSRLSQARTRFSSPS